MSHHDVGDTRTPWHRFGLAHFDGYRRSYLFPRSAIFSVRPTPQEQSPPTGLQCVRTVTFTRRCRPSTKSRPAGALLGPDRDNSTCVGLFPQAVAPAFHLGVFSALASAKACRLLFPVLFVATTPSVQADRCFRSATIYPTFIEVSALVRCSLSSWRSIISEPIPSPGL